jgi:Lar family restriction alleviation protein
MSDISNEELLPCPFCGNLPRFIRFSYQSAPEVYLYSIHCCTVTMSNFNTEKYAIESWNRRKVNGGIQRLGLTVK